MRTTTAVNAVLLNSSAPLFMVLCSAVRASWAALPSCSRSRPPARWPAPAEALGVLYIALAASVLAFAFWNRGVADVGANAAGFLTILCGVFLATRR